MRIGAHMSVAGGVSKAVDRAVVHRCEALQIFTKNANQWRAKPLDPAEIKLFRQRIEQTGITPVVSHASYLINLATTFPLLREQSLAAFIDELDRADALGLLGVVIHPGTCTAGYDIVSADGYRDTFAHFERIVGLDRLKVFHGNDSKKPCGSRVDRHEHIGEGCLGVEPFRRLLHDPRFAGLPILIETAKSRGTERPHRI